jgi:ribose transport system substrate-binding protein
MRQHRILVIALVICLALALALVAGCGGKTRSAGPSGGNGADNGKPTPAANGNGYAKPPGVKWVIGMSQCNLGEPWRVQMNGDIKAAAAKHPEIHIIYKDAQNKSETQQAQVRELVDQGVDLIIISPKEAKPLTAPVAEAFGKGIPVIVLDRKVEGKKYTQFIGADNIKIGRAAGKYLAKLLKGSGNVIELQGLMTSTPGQERHTGFMQGIVGSSLVILFQADCKWLEPDAQREMSSALSRFPQIDAVYGHNDPSAHGAYLAAKQEGKGREKTIKFIGIDALPHEGIRYVKEGILTATFEYPTGGKEAIDNALKILNGEKVPKNITLGTRIYTKANVNKGGEAVE